MRKLFLAAMIVAGLSVSAQNYARAEGQPGREKLTTEQRNQLQLKKMTLDLGLSDSQQKEMSKIIAEGASKREAAMAEMKTNREKGIKPTSEQRYAKQNQMLDEQIAMKERVKKVLSKEQFEKWEKMHEERKENRHQRRRDYKGGEPKSK